MVTSSIINVANFEQRFFVV